MKQQVVEEIISKTTLKGDDQDILDAAKRNLEALEEGSLNFILLGVNLRIHWERGMAGEVL